MKPLAAILTGFVLFAASAAMGQEAPYRGPGGQLEAVGAVAAVFAVTVATIEACGRHPTQREESKRVGNQYVVRNKPVYVAMMERLPRIAQRNGGDGEVQRLKAELETGLGQIENMSRGMADSRAKTPGDCSRFLRRVAERRLDLRSANTEHLSRLGL